ncbi:MAG: DUF3727 domain-containing protein [Cyanobacteria bacterium]|nr:DUF3727 domain-containing protein [Cyanobacteriota bacterium]
MSTSNYENMEDYEEDNVPTITLSDSAGRSLECYVEQEIDIDNETYLLLLPVDYPVEFIQWTGDDDDEEAVLVEEDADIDRLFPIAKAVLEEQNLILKRTAAILTVEGDLPDPDDDEDDVDAEDTEDMGSRVQLLANFYVEDQEYGICTPLDPFFIPARLGADGKPQLLSPEEHERIEPMLSDIIEAHLFDDLDED